MNDRADKGFARAERSIEGARRELAADAPDFAANHAYYAMFYVAEALLFTRGLTTDQATTLIDRAKEFLVAARDFVSRAG